MYGNLEGTLLLSNHAIMYFSSRVVSNIPVSSSSLAMTFIKARSKPICMWLWMLMSFYLI